jgi:penicillin amidase
MAFSLRKGRAAVLRAVAIALLVVVVIVVGILAWIIRSPLPKVNGTQALSGIAAPVTIRRDERGIAHVQAASETDALFGEGFACAQDRLWQMDFLRRTAEGKLSEVAGPATLPIDVYMRTVGLAVAAQNDAAHLRGQALADAQAYAAGVNASITSHPLPLEFRLLGYRPAPWTPVDSIAIIKLMAQRLDDQWDLVELRGLLERKVGVVAAGSLMDAQVPGLEHYANRPTRTPQAAAVAPPNAAFAPLAFAAGGNPLPPDPQSGSNNWAVSGSRVTTGKPVLSNDTHLEHAVPSTYWLTQLEAPGFDVAGFIVPGIPFVALGHNRRIAFGVTSGDAAVQDLYIETFRSPSSDEYLADGRWLRASHRIEEINVKGQSPHRLDVLVTRHGPVVKRNGTRAFALRWTILEGGDELDLLRLLDRASNWQDFEGGLARVVGPVFNWAYADVDGNIGYHLAARIPHRLHGDGSVPVEGQDDRYAWDGYIPFDKLPHAFNPARGFLATANNQLEPTTTEIGASTFFDSPYRIDRIYARLQANSQMSPQEIGAIQLDDVDTARLRFAKAIVRLLIARHDPRLRAVAAGLASWDGRATVTSPIPTFLMAVENALTSRLLEPKLGPVLTARYTKSYSPVVVFDRILDGDTSLRTLGITRMSVAAALPWACGNAAGSLGVTAHDGFARVTPWGDDNKAVFDHPLGIKWPVDALFNIHSFAQAGDGFTVDANKPGHGPASRLVDDLANWDDSSMLLTLGESGQFNSPHYQDEVRDFAAARWVPFPFSDAAVRAATKDTLVLNPKI